MTQFVIQVVEYQSARPRKKVSPHPSDFVLNDRQLVVAMVRSILTVNSGKSTRKYMAAIVRPTLQFLLEWKSAPKLRISDSFNSFVRDFSVTTRIGELAQGISYAFWMWERGYSWISDFGPWARTMLPPYAAKKSPDYVMFNPTTGDVALMEAKGTQSAAHQSPMRNALNQCKEALPHVFAARGYGSVLTLDTKNVAGLGKLHIRDPDRKFVANDEMRHFLFRRSYASWFDLLGKDDLTSICRQHVRTHLGDIQDAIVYGQEGGSVLCTITSMALGLNPARARYSINPEIWLALNDIEAFQKFDWLQFSERIKTLANRGQGIYFPDGTSIVED